MLEDLTNVGYFLDVVRKDVETEFLPWLSRGVAQNLEKSRLAKLVVDGKHFLCFSFSFQFISFSIFLEMWEYLMIILSF